MGLRATAAKAVGGTITAIRIPADATLRLVGRGPLGGVLEGVVEAADATCRVVAGRVLGSDELREHTERRRVVPDERDRAPSASEEAPAEQSKAESKAGKRAKAQRRPGPSSGAKTSPRKTRAVRRKPRGTQPRQARPGEAVSGFPEPPGEDPGDISRDTEPHHALSNPVVEPDPTEWPDPYDPREDPRDPPDPDGQPFGEEPHVATGSMSTSEPHPREDPEAGERQNAPERDRLDD